MRYNRLGQPVLGRGWRWLDDTRQIRQLCDASGCRLADQYGGLIDARDATVIAANAGQYAGFLQSTPPQVFANFPFTSTDSFIADIGLDGTAAELTFDRRLVGIAGQPRSTFLAGEVQSARIADGHLIVTFYDGRIVSHVWGRAGIPAGVKPENATLVGGLLLYHTQRWLVLQKFGERRGVIVKEATSNEDGTFSPDGWVDAPRGEYVIGWNPNPGETTLRDRRIPFVFALEDLSALTDATGPIVVPPPPPPVDPPEEPPVSDRLPDNIRAVREAYVARFPVPQMDGPGPADDAFENLCRAWIKALAQQIVFSTGDTSWGVKNAGGGRPQSKDSLAHQVGDRLINFDLLLGVGTGHPSLVADPQGDDITGQVFMPVSGVNHLGTTPPPPPTQPPPTDDLLPIILSLERDIAGLKAAFEKFVRDVSDIQDIANGAATVAARALEAASQPLPALRVKGRTASGLYGSHSHELDLPVVRE